VAGCQCKRQLFQKVVDMKEIMISLFHKLECVDKFCYLGDLIGAGGGAEETLRARIRCALVKYRELVPVLTSRGASLQVKGKVRIHGLYPEICE